MKAPGCQLQSGVWGGFIGSSSPRSLPCPSPGSTVPPPQSQGWREPQSAFFNRPGAPGSSCSLIPHCPRGACPPGTSVGRWAVLSFLLPGPLGPPAPPRSFVPEEPLRAVPWRQRHRSPHSRRSAQNPREPPPIPGALLHPSAEALPPPSPAASSWRRLASLVHTARARAGPEWRVVRVGEPGPQRAGVETRLEDPPSLPLGAGFLAAWGAHQVRSGCRGAGGGCSLVRSEPPLGVRVCAPR